MKKSICSNLLKAVKIFPANNVFLLTGTMILLIPMIVTIGQYLNSGYFMKSSPVLLFYWPGTDLEVKIQVLVLIITGLFFISFLSGITYLVYKRTLGKVMLTTIFIFVCATLLKTLLSASFGWKESALPDLAGKADSLILSLWHNPIWEEVIFRGLPLLILLGIEKYGTGRRTLPGVLIYYLVPSVLCGLYHIPGHGLLRFFDTLIISSGFAWLALRFTFLAPVVMHYIADAMLILNLNKLPGIRPDEIAWINQYGPSFNTFFSLFILFFLFLVPVLLIYYYTRLRRQTLKNV